MNQEKQRIIITRQSDSHEKEIFLTSFNGEKKIKHKQNKANDIFAHKMEK